MKVSILDDNVDQTTTDIVNALDTITNSLFILESVLVLTSMLITIKIERAFNRDIVWSNLFFRSGILDLCVAILCFIYRDSSPGHWFRILRVLTLARVYLEIFPYIDILTVRIEPRSNFFYVNFCN